MSKLRTLLSSAAVMVSLGCGVVSAQPTLYDYMLNVNGTTYCPSSSTNTCSSLGGFSAVSALNSSGFNTSTGTGTLSLIFNPGSAGTYNVSLWIWDDVAAPVYNEYGAVNGSASAGQSWQIDIPDYESDSNHTGNIIANTAANKLGNTNHIPGTSDNYLLECTTGSNCNDDTSMAMGFKFTLTASQKEVITWTLGSSNPGGFSLEQIHPVDGNNSSASDLFFSGSAALGTKSTIPEPTSWSLVGFGVASLLFAIRRRLRKD